MKQKPCRPAIATWWEACIYNAEDPLIPVEVFAFTDNTVTILDERILTHTGYVKRERTKYRQTGDIAYFPTFQEAQKWLLAKALNDVNRYNDLLGDARQKLQRWAALTEPPSAADAKESAE